MEIFDGQFQFKRDQNTHKKYKHQTYRLPHQINYTAQFHTF